MRSITLIIIIIILAILTSLCRAQESSIVGIDIYEGGQVIGYGQGTVYRQDTGKTYILTAWHCCHSHWKHAGAEPLKVVARHGEAEQVCKIAAWDVEHDLAVLTCPPLEGADAIGVASGFEIGQPLKYYGRDMTRTGTAHECSLSGFIWSDCVSVRGDSGGPICDENGDLVGVISGGALAFEPGERLTNSGSNVWPTRAGGSPSIETLFVENLELAPADWVTRLQDILNKRNSRGDEWNEPVPAKPKPLTKAGILAVCEQINRPVLAVVSASWCGPCQKLKNGTLADLKASGDLEGLTLLVLDYDKDRASSKNLMTGTSIPQMVYFHKGDDGKWCCKATKGYKTDEQVRQFINK